MRFLRGFHEVLVVKFKLKIFFLFSTKIENFFRQTITLNFVVVMFLKFKTAEGHFSQSFQSVEYLTNFYIFLCCFFCLYFYLFIPRIESTFFLCMYKNVYWNLPSRQKTSKVKYKFNVELIHIIKMVFYSIYSGCYNQNNVRFFLLFEEEVFCCIGFFNWFLFIWIKQLGI